MPLHPPPPKVLALLLAQYVHQDPRTGLYSLHDVFDAIATPTLPVAQTLGVFMQLTELHLSTTALRPVKSKRLLGIRTPLSRLRTCATVIDTRGACKPPARIAVAV